MADTHGSNAPGPNGGVSWDKAAQDNRAVYSGFLGLTKWALVLIALVLIGMAIFLV
jgi:hypothetical protein